MQYYDPYGAAGFAPQGMFGNIFHSIAPTLGGAIGGALGNAGLGRQIGGMAGQLGQRYIPFGADPSFAPQGFFGDLAGALAPAVGGMVGGLAGNPALGQQIGHIAGQLGQQYIPFGADPSFAPQGFLGNMFGQVAPHLGSAIGGRFGNAALGQQIGNIAGGLGRRFIPFSNEPQYAPQGIFGDVLGMGGALANKYLPFSNEQQFAPQGFLGNMFGQVAPHLGSAIGGRFGNAALGQQIGNIAGGLGRRFIPFGNEPQYAPQGFFGDLAGALAPAVGGMVGGLAGNPALGQQIGHIAGQLGQQYIPFSSEPQYAPQGIFGDVLGMGGALANKYLPFSNEQQFAPQGFFGNLIGAAAPIAGGLFGGPVGGAVGSGVGALARRYIPFSADPYAQQGWGMA